MGPTEAGTEVDQDSPRRVLIRIEENVVKSTTHDSTGNRGDSDDDGIVMTRRPDLGAVPDPIRHQPTPDFPRKVRRTSAGPHVGGAVSANESERNEHAYTTPTGPALAVVSYHKDCKHHHGRCDKLNPKDGARPHQVVWIRREDIGRGAERMRSGNSQNAAAAFELGDLGGIEVVECSGYHSGDGDMDWYKLDDMPQRKAAQDTKRSCYGGVQVNQSHGSGHNA